MVARPHYGTPKMWVAARCGPVRQLLPLLASAWSAILLLSLEQLGQLVVTNCDVLSDRTFLLGQQVLDLVYVRVESLGTQGRYLYLAIATATQTSAAITSISTSSCRISNLPINWHHGRICADVRLFQANPYSFSSCGKGATAPVRYNLYRPRLKAVDLN